MLRSNLPEFPKNLECLLMGRTAVVVEGEEFAGIDGRFSLRLLTTDRLSLTADRFCKIASTMSLLPPLTQREF